MLRRILLVGSIGIVYLVSCSKPEGKIEPIDYSSFPLQVGQWKEYQVDSVVYDEFYKDNPDKHMHTSSTLMREVVARTGIDNTGKSYYQIERYRRNNDTLDWQFDKVYMAQLTNTTAEVTEDNTKEIKLVFPIEQDVSWNGNAYNAHEVWKYKYIATSTSFTILGKTYANALRVLQYESSNFIQKKYYEERYASGIGLIYKEAINDSTQNPPKIEGGTEVKISLIKYGNQ